MKIRKSWIAVAAAAGILLAGCSSSGGDSGAADEAPAANEEAAADSGDDGAAADAGDGEAAAAGGIEPLNIHIVAAKTGIISPFDIQPAEAFTMAIDELNAAGGIGGQQATARLLEQEGSL